MSGMGTLVKICGLRSLPEARAARQAGADLLGFIFWKPGKRYIASFLGVLPVGGLPSSRVYLRFNLPGVLIDSSTTIVRATLILHQRGDSTFQRVDSIALTPRVVIASPVVTDVAKAALLLANLTTVPLRSVRANPNQVRNDTIALVSRASSIVTLWRAEGPERMQRAIVLQSSAEGRDPRRFFIFGNTAVPDTLRPRLHLTYIPRSGFGLP